MAQGSNPFYIDPGAADITPVLRGISAISQQSRQANKQQMAQNAVMEAVQSNDPMKMAEIAIQYPEYADAAKNAFGFTNQASEGYAKEAYRRALSDPENAAQHIKKGIELVNQAGGKPVMMTNDLQMLQSNPEGALQAMKMGYAGVDPEGYKALYGDPKEKFKQQEIDLKRETLDIRKMENEARKDEQALKNETNQLKRDELQLKIEEKRNTIDQKKKDINDKASSAVLQLDDNIAAVDRLLTHPGLPAAIGTSSVVPAIPGTDRASFEAELDSFDAKVFLSAVKQMKGMGALSENEGRKISAAAGAINPKMKEKDFIRSLTTIKEGFEKAKANMASQGIEPKPAEQVNSGQVNIDDLVNKYAD